MYIPLFFFFCGVTQQHLGLAGNPIVGVRHLSGLRGLPSLMELTLDDIHFGTCPVVTKEGYRHFVMCCLRQVSWTTCADSTAERLGLGESGRPCTTLESTVSTPSVVYLTFALCTCTCTHTHARQKKGPRNPLVLHLFARLTGLVIPPPLEAACDVDCPSRPNPVGEGEGPKRPYKKREEKKEKSGAVLALNQTKAPTLLCTPSPQRNMHPPTCLLAVSVRARSRTR